MSELPERFSTSRLPEDAYKRVVLWEVIRTDKGNITELEVNLMFFGIRYGIKVDGELKFFGRYELEVWSQIGSMNADIQWQIRRAFIKKYTCSRGHTFTHDELRKDALVSCPCCGQWENHFDVG